MRELFSLRLSYLLYPARYLLVFLALFVISLGGYLLWCRLFHTQRARANVMARILLIDVVITILIVTIVSTLSGHIPGVSSLDLIPFHTLNDYWVMGDGIKYFSVLMNIIMFMPLGFLLPVVHKKFQHWHIVLLSSTAFSVLIEFLQYFIGRSSDIDDVLANSFGAMLGYGLFILLRNHLHHKADSCRKSKKEESL